ncbi:MAG: hypothetical protein J7576_18485 [Siphonobacter aquaeclarae]|nr:hypothetical protein [Siphonobacter aquaeclarae]
MHIDPAELRSQQVKAKANWQLKTRLKMAGKATDDEVLDALRIYESLRNYQAAAAPLSSQAVDEKPAGAAPAVNPKPEIFLPQMSEAEFTKVLEDLTIERHEAHKQMCLLSNSLADYPDNENVKAVVDDIQAFKRQRNQAGEKIAYLKANKRLPAEEPRSEGESSSATAEAAFLANLPAERYEVHRLLKDSLLPNLSKARRKLELAATELNRLHYAKKVSILEAQVAAARGKMAWMG